MRSQIKALKKLWPELVRVMLYDLLLGRGKIQARPLPTPRSKSLPRTRPLFRGRDGSALQGGGRVKKVLLEHKNFLQESLGRLKACGKPLATSLLGALAVALLSATRIEQLEEEPGRCNA
jgi:hypothetical protein